MENNEEIKEAMEELEEVSKIKQLRRIAELKDKAIRDEKNGLRHATEDGINIGLERGRKEGIKEGIQALIVTCKELGADFDKTEDKVKQRFHLSDADAAENMRLYW